MQFLECKKKTAFAVKVYIWVKINNVALNGHSYIILYVNEKSII